MRLYGKWVANKFAVEQFRKGTVPRPANRLQFIDLGQPRLSEVARVVAADDMRVGAYTVANQPEVPRRLTVTHAVAVGVDTLGYIEIEGTNILDDTIVETIIPEEDDTVITENIFKSVTRIEGFDWVIGAANEDQLSVGLDDLLGIPISLEGYEQLIFAMLGTEIISPDAFDAYVVDDLPNAAIDVSGATYDGTKRLYLLAYYNEIYVS